MKKNKIIISKYMNKQDLFVISAGEYFLALRKAEIDGVIAFITHFDLIKEEFKHYLENRMEDLEGWEKVYGGDWAETGQLTEKFRDLCEMYKEEK